MSMPVGSAAFFVPPTWVTNAVFASVAGLLFPVVLLMLPATFLFPELIEELAKAIVILLLVLPAKGHAPRVVMGAWSGLLFGFSESLLYLNQIIQSGDISTFWQRLFLTTPMHAVTAAAIVFGGIRGRVGLAAGAFVAILAHVGFNRLIG